MSLARYGQIACRGFRKLQRPRVIDSILDIDVNDHLLTTTAPQLQLKEGMADLIEVASLRPKGLWERVLFLGALVP